MTENVNCGCYGKPGSLMDVVHCPRHSEENVARLEGIIVESIENGAPMAEWEVHVKQSKELATTKAALARLEADLEQAKAKADNENSDHQAYRILHRAATAAIAAAQEALRD